MNKSRIKGLMILLAILIVGVIAAVLLTRHEEKKEQIRVSDEIIMNVDPEQVTAVSWDVKDGAGLGFHKRDGVWLYDADETFPVSEAKLMELIKVFRQFGAGFVIENVEDYGQYGLDKPICTIKLTEGGQTRQIDLGVFSTMDEQRYVSIGDGKVYLVSNDPMNYYDVGLEDLIDHSVIPRLIGATKITFRGKDNWEIYLDTSGKDSCTIDDVYFTNHKPLDRSRVENYLKKMHNLNLIEYVTYAATPEELKKYGLDDPTLSVTVEYPDSKGETRTVTLHLAGDLTEEGTLKAQEVESSSEERASLADMLAEYDSTLPAEEKVEEEISKTKAKAFARVDDSGIIYAISDSGFERLMLSSYDDLRHKDVMTAEFDDIDKIRIETGDREYLITGKTLADAKRWYFDGVEFSMDTIEKKVKQLKCTEFTDAQPEGKPEMTMTFMLNNKNFPEIKVEIYRYNGRFCLAKVNGESVGLILRTACVEAMEAIHQIVLG